MSAVPVENRPVENEPLGNEPVGNRAVGNRVWLELEPPSSCDVRDGCITCGDIAVELIVTELAGPDAVCRDEQGGSETVAVELVGPVQLGDRLLVHAGVALERLPELPEEETS